MVIKLIEWPRKRAILGLNIIWKMDHFKFTTLINLMQFSDLPKITEIAVYLIRLCPVKWWPR